MRSRWLVPRTVVAVILCEIMRLKQLGAFDDTLTCHQPGADAILEKRSNIQRASLFPSDTKRLEP